MVVFFRLYLPGSVACLKHQQLSAIMFHYNASAFEQFAGEIFQHVRLKLHLNGPGRILNRNGESTYISEGSQRSIFFSETAFNLYLIDKQKFTS